MKKILLFIILATFVISCNKVDFDKKGKETFKQIKDISALSLKINSITGEVWRRAIYDHEYALCESKNFDDCYVSDFNYAIQRFNKDKNIISLRQTLLELDKQVALNMDSIANPSSKNKEVYENLIDLYKNTKEITNEAINPTGSLSSFIDKSNKIGNDINMITTEIETRKPDWKN